MSAPSSLAVQLKQLMLRPPALTLAVAESLTCGRVQARVGEVSGASDFFLGGITAYSLNQKVEHLRVARASAQRVNSVSAKVAEQMARGVCALFGSDLGVATTGYAEPSTNWKVREPFAWWAVCHRAERNLVRVFSGRVECPGASRIEVQAMIADAALGELLEYLRALRARK